MSNFSLLTLPRLLLLLANGKNFSPAFSSSAQAHLLFLQTDVCEKLQNYENIISSTHLITQTVWRVKAGVRLDRVEVKMTR
jgi:hypothetical protein